ncbi:hypothetical protein AKO1_007212 [Acrasis kona]|uniref:HMG box domain-containing protein n=1 Tax=Acrasis kona TaxID=1008807 RepID=A0AAW2YU84_9EUKA
MQRGLLVKKMISIYDENGALVTSIHGALNNKALYFSKSKTKLHVPVAPSIHTIHSVLGYLSAVANSSAEGEPRAERRITTSFIADYETFCTEVEPLVLRRDLEIDELLSSLYDIYTKHTISNEIIEDTKNKQHSAEPTTTVNTTAANPNIEQRRNTTIKEGTAKVKQKRALTAFNLFYRDKCMEFREQNNDPSISESGRVAPRIAKAWRLLTEDERNVYHEKARLRLLNTNTRDNNNNNATHSTHSTSPVEFRSDADQPQDSETSNQEYRFYNYVPRRMNTNNASPVLNAPQPPQINQPQINFNQNKRPLSDVISTDVNTLPPIFQKIDPIMSHNNIFPQDILPPFENTHNTYMHPFVQRPQGPLPPPQHLTFQEHTDNKYDEHQQQPNNKNQRLF